MVEHAGSLGVALYILLVPALSGLSRGEKLRAGEGKIKNSVLGFQYRLSLRLRNVEEQGQGVIELGGGSAQKWN